MTWKVERWGGAAHHKRRVIFLGSEDKAREKYQATYLALRQGLVALVDPDGKTVRQYGASRGRSSGNIAEFA